MESIVDWIGRLQGRAPRTVVHVGVGGGAALERYAALPPARRPDRVVLIEGDAETAAELERQASAHAWARVVHAIAAPAAGPWIWNRYNVPALNGPLDMKGLIRWYPRLRRTQTGTQPARAITDLLQEALPDAAASGPSSDMLVMDVPGQESGLLRSLPSELLLRFTAVLLRGCSEPLDAGASAELAVSELAERHFVVDGAERDAQPLWPITLLSLDRSAAEAARLMGRVRELKEELEHLREENQALVRERGAVSTLEARVRDLSETASLRERALKELQQRVDMLGQTHDALLRDKQDLQARVELMSQLKDTAEGALAQQSALVEELTHSRDWHSRAGKDRQAQIDKLSAENAELREQRKARIAELDACRAALETCSAQAAQATKAASDRASHIDPLNAELAKLKAARDEAVKTSTAHKRNLDSARMQIVGKQRQIDELEARMKQLAQRQGLLDDELAKAEGQLALVKDLLLYSHRTD